MANNSIQESTIHLIAQFEGCILHPYKDSGGTWTIGFGATYDIHGNPVTSSTPPITMQQADQLLAKQLVSYAASVNHLVKVTLTQNQFDACVSLCYNIGAGGFLQSTVLKDINAGNFPGAQQAFLLWNKVAGKVSPTLVSRRKAEMELFGS